MKAKLLFILSCIITTSWSQNFSDKTNAVHLNFNEPSAATTLPSIVWTTPRIERSNSVEESITFEVSVQSNIPLTKIVFELTSGGETKSKSIDVGKNLYFKQITQPIRLLEGENTIKLIAENEKGGKVSSTRAVLMGREDRKSVV